MPKTRPALLMLLLATSMVLGCSGSGMNPAEPADAPDLSSDADAPGSNRMLWGIWEVGFNPVTSEIAITPTRNALAHFNITDWLLPPNCEDCLKISVNSYDPVGGLLDADVTLRNPTQLSGYDVRGILYTNDYGHLLENADAWTDLWEMPGGDDINPFKAFAKTEANRIFIPDAEHTGNYQIYIPIPPNWNQITFAVDASWPGNCKEPYAIENFLQENEIYEIQYYGTDIYIDVLDWQDDVTEVILYSEEFTDDPAENLTNTGGNTWKTYVYNHDLHSPGEYPVLLEAISENPGVQSLYQYVTITVSESPLPDLTDVTPAGLNFCPNDIFIDGSLMYVAADVNGLYIFDITDPLNPALVSNAETQEDAIQVAVSSGYAYVVEEHIKGDEVDVEIFDVSAPESPVSVNTLEDVAKHYYDMEISGDLLYVTTCSPYSCVIDISTPESAYVIASGIFHGEDIDIQDNTAYIALTNGLRIYDISNPSEPAEIGFVETPKYGRDVDVSGDYAYYVCSEGFYVMDISEPAEAETVGVIDTPQYATEIIVQNDYAYVSTGFGYNFTVIDVSNPTAPFIVKEIDLECRVMDLCLYGEYAYVVTEYSKIWIIDISTPEMTHVAGLHESIGYAMELAISDGYAYVVSVGTGGNLQIVDIDPPEEANIVVTVEFPYSCTGITLGDDGYAYVCGYIYDSMICPVGYLYIVDIDLSGESEIVAAIEMPDLGRPSNVKLYGGYALVADPYNGVYIVDIDPLETAAVVGMFDEVYGKAVYDLVISGEYAFCIGGTLSVIDIEPIESAHVAAEILGVTPGGSIVLSGNYVYTVGPPGYSLYYIIDIHEPLSPEIVSYVPPYHPSGGDVAVSGGYAFYALDYGLGIADVDPPEAASLVEIVEVKGNARGVAISGDYVYLADSTGGLRIYKVW